MVNSAKFLVSRRAPAKPWFHDGKTYEEKTEEEKKENPPNFQTSTSLTPAGKFIKGLLDKWIDYTDHVKDNYNEILDNGNGNLVSGIINTTIKDVGGIINSAKETIEEVSGTSTPQTGAVAKPIVYSDWTPASKLFGMDQSTAFSEHMANTAHQREVADLKAAGLNPVLGISGSGSSSVSGNVIASSSAQKAQEFPWMDVLGATAGLITTIVSKKPALGYMVSNVFKSFD